LTTTAAALTSAATLLLTGCGGVDGQPSSKKVRAIPEPSSPSTSAPAQASPNPVRPKITLPSSFQLTFEDWQSSDPVEQAVLHDGREDLRAGYAAIIANDPDSEAVTFYETEAARGQSRQWIRSYTDKNVNVIGRLPVFDPEVAVGDNGVTALLSYCTDESKAYTKHRKTGEVVGNPAGTDPEVFYQVSLRKNAQDVWQTMHVRGDRGGCY
jgi:hypothetical protein